MNSENLRAGWVSVYRSMLEHHIWTQHPAEYLKIWLYFLMRAAHKPRAWFDGEREITIPVGGFVGSLTTISDNCRVSRKQAEKAVAMLKRCKMVEATGGQRYSLYVIVNFAAYQSREEQEGTPRGRRGDAEGTVGGQSGDDQGTLRGLNNKEYEIRNKKYPPVVEISEPPKPAPAPKPTVQPSPLEDIALETATAHYAARTASSDKVAQALISQGAGEGPLLLRWQAYHAWYVKKTNRQYQQHVLALIADGGWKDAQIPNEDPEDNW